MAARAARALEVLARLEELPPSGAFVLAAAPCVAGATGGPARVVAFLP
jgi:kynurenine formamidase